jgi:hypothetical protein
MRARKPLRLLTRFPGAQVGGVRVRQHVNPLSSRYSAVAPCPAWATLFEDATRPLVLDLGCGSGRFLLALADKDATDAAPAPARNYLGIEIREPLVGRAQSWAEKKGMDKRVRYEATNANVNAPAWLEAYPGPLQLVSILHPDPHWCELGAPIGQMQFSSLTLSSYLQEAQAPQAAHRAAGAGARHRGAAGPGWAAVPAERREGGGGGHGVCVRKRGGL